jgi:hypothetical protein
MDNSTFGWNGSDKIPWKIPNIDCVITLPEQIEEQFTKLLAIYKKKSSSKKKLKKKFNRITTDKLLNFEDKEYLNNLFTELSLALTNPEKLTIMLENKIIDYIDFIIKKYMKVYIHIDDQIFLISEKNKDNNKIFLKFYFPKVKNDNEDITIENKINKFGDNIHFTLLPEVLEHGMNGMFHLTFRIEGHNGKPLYEYSKFISFNIVDCKVGIILYDDEKGNNAIIFRISNNLQELNNSIETEVFKDICLYIALDIFKKLFDCKKIDSFFSRHLNTFGVETVYKMINKLMAILLSTFMDLYVNSTK